MSRSGSTGIGAGMPLPQFARSWSLCVCGSDIHVAIRIDRASGQECPSHNPATANLPTHNGREPEIVISLDRRLRPGCYRRIQNRQTAAISTRNTPLTTRVTSQARVRSDWTPLIRFCHTVIFHAQSLFARARNAPSELTMRSKTSIGRMAGISFIALGPAASDPVRRGSRQECLPRDQDRISLKDSRRGATGVGSPATFIAEATSFKPLPVTRQTTVSPSLTFPAARAFSRQA